MSINVIKNPAGRKPLSTLFKGRGAELGVERAKYSVEIMKTADFMYAIDLWEPYGEYRQHVTPEYYLEIYEDAVQRLAGKNVEFLKMFTKDAANLIEDNSLNWIYVDAAHDEKSVYEDLTNFYNKVVSGGIIAGHDFTGKEGKAVQAAVFKFCDEKGIDEITEWCGDKAHSFHFLKH